MALVKFGGGIVQMSGSMAGNTYARNRYGNYVRSRTKPVNPNTALQQIVRASMALLTTRWAETLSAAQRTAWNLYGANVVMTNKLGEAINLTGFNHYIRSNMILKQYGGPAVDDGPTTFELPDADPTFAVAAEEAGQTLSFTYDANLAWASEDDAHMVFYQGTPQNAQRNFFDGPWRKCTIASGNSGGAPASPKVGAAVFVVTEGQRLWVYGRILRADGRLSEPFRADTFCVA